ncbi:MAG: GNAT family N-acetyltransferase [Clostridium sp.]|nr:GNAT family N-acetyltransferase [Clostridium sp.]
MILIRKLTLADMHEAMVLKALCWPEELAGLSDNQMNIEVEFKFWTEWMQRADENNDMRILYGAFENEKMLGVIFASFVESRDEPEAGMEINGLWVYKQHRKKGISLMLMDKVLDEFLELGSRKAIVYNFHNSSSNSYYRKLGFNVIDTEYQMRERLPVDILACDMEFMKNTLQEKLTGEYYV